MTTTKNNGLNIDSNEWESEEPLLPNHERQTTSPRGREGRMSARSRIDAFVDTGSFREVGAHRKSGLSASTATDGVITGTAEVDGRPVCIYAQDSTIMGGSLGHAHADKICHIYTHALNSLIPIIGLIDSGGARIQEGVNALHGYGRIFKLQVQASGVIPQAAVILGPCAGGAAYAPALADVIFMVAGSSQLYLTGPSVVAEVTGEEVTHEELGGSTLHGTESGTATFVSPDEASCLEDVRHLITLLPANNREQPPRWLAESPAGGRSISSVVPPERKSPYDMVELINALCDGDGVIQFNELWAQNIVCGLALLDGRLTGIVANQPHVLAGVIDSDASRKAARFVTFCDAFNIPLLTIVDVPGFLPGKTQEAGGVIRDGAKLLYAYCDAQTPRIQLIVRKAYGGAYIVMDCSAIGSDLSLAWPGNEVAVMGAESAVEIIHRKQISQAEDPAVATTKYVESYRENHMHSYVGAEAGYIHDIIEPDDTRDRLIREFRVLAENAPRHGSGPRRHGNQPT